jgi:hypothetical protein
MAELRSLAAKYEWLVDERQAPTFAMQRALLFRLQQAGKRLAIAARPAEGALNLGASVDYVLKTHGVRHSCERLGFFELLDIIHDIEVVLANTRLPDKRFHQAARKPEAAFYGVEVPRVFKRLFGRPYSVRTGDRRLGPGGRFAVAVADLFGRHPPAIEALHKAYTRDKRTSQKMTLSR